jgi:hypothetical protein
MVDKASSPFGKQRAVYSHGLVSNSESRLFLPQPHGALTSQLCQVDFQVVGRGRCRCFRRIALFLVFFVTVELGVSSVKDDLHRPVASEVVHEDASCAALVKVGRSLFEQRVDGELEVELLDADFRKVVGERRGLSRSLCRESCQSGNRFCRELL